ncbi:MAG: M20/M25/M40 family metallo-hydrolase [Planctomycetaceae bacterium]|nr:M20/M25/M40 family metallo-hydrolase [Planctomycetaceae bacterium]
MTVRQEEYRMPICGRHGDTLTHKLCWIVLLLWPTITAGADDASSVRQRLETDIHYLASDELKGRGVGTPELDQAADFIQQEFAKAGLQTAIYDQGAFQYINLPGRVTIGAPEKNSLAFTIAAQPATDGEGNEETDRIDLVLNRDFRPLAIGGSNQITAPVVFAGYGITAPEYNYDDYEGLDVNGKAVLIIRKEPQQTDRKSVFEGRKHTEHAHFRKKIANAAAHGATAVILVNDRHGVDKLTRSLKFKWERRLNQLQKEQQQQEQRNEQKPDAFSEHRDRVVRLGQELNDLDKQLDAADKIPAVDGAGTGEDEKGLPVFFCRRPFANQLLKESGAADLRSLEDQLDELRPAGQELDGVQVLASASLDPVRAKNVLALLEGQGPLAKETLIIGAHYDHVGMGGSGSLAPWTREIHNGADDNASGVVILLEIARRLAALPERPKRRILFIAFSAEEIGLLGSQHYTREPRYPLSQTVAMLNLDMVGRLGDQALTIQGLDTATEFEAWLAPIAAKNQLKYQRKAGGNGPSDHASFFAEQIPVMHFFSGLHRDYHRPTDDVEKIDLAGMQQISNVVIDMAWKLANSEVRPTFQAKAPKKEAEQAISGEKANADGASAEKNRDTDPIPIPTTDRPDSPEVARPLQASQPPQTGQTDQDPEP